MRIKYKQINIITNIFLFNKYNSNNISNHMNITKINYIEHIKI